MKLKPIKWRRVYKGVHESTWLARIRGGYLFRHVSGMNVDAQSAVMVFVPRESMERDAKWTVTKKKF